MTKNSFKLIINKIKNINYLEHEFSLEKGVYIISSENGNGKSTLFSVISQLVNNKRAFGTGLNVIPLRKKPTATDAYIEYKFNGLVDRYEFDTKGSNYWITKNNKKKNIKEFNGFCELSITYGTRFIYTKNIFGRLENKITANNVNITPADNWIVEKFGEIIRNNIDYYKGKLKIVDKTKIEGRLGDFRKSKHRNIYLINHGNEVIYPYEFSTGENLILGILDFLYQLKSSNYTKKSIILVDEIEIGLHPAAQKRLLKVLDEIINSQNLDLCIYLSTHSPTIISNIPNVDNLFELNNKGNVTKLEQRPKSTILQILTKDLHKDNFIFVEDNTAKIYIDSLIKICGLNSRSKYEICAIGGFDNTKKLHFQLLPLFTNKLTTILDGDCKEKVTNSIESMIDDKINVLKNGQNTLFQLKDLFDKISTHEPLDLRERLNENIEIKNILDLYDVNLSEYDKTDNNKKKSLKKELKIHRDDLSSKLKEHLEKYYFERISFLPVPCLETFLFKDCVKNETNHSSLINKINKLIIFPV